MAKKEDLAVESIKVFAGVVVFGGFFFGLLVVLVTMVHFLIKYVEWLGM